MGCGVWGVCVVGCGLSGVICVGVWGVVCGLGVCGTGCGVWGLPLVGCGMV